MKYEEKLRKNEKSQKQYFYFRLLPYEMMRYEAEALHARIFWCPGLEFDVKT